MLKKQLQPKSLLPWPARSWWRGRCHCIKKEEIKRKTDCKLTGSSTVNKHITHAIQQEWHFRIEAWNRDTVWSLLQKKILGNLHEYKMCITFGGQPEYSWYIFKAKSEQSMRDSLVYRIMWLCLQDYLARGGDGEKYRWQRNRYLTAIKREYLFLFNFQELNPF